MKITLPVSGKEIELAVWTWEKSKGFFKRAADFVSEGHNNEEWMERVLSECYSQDILDEVLQASPDALALYNDTVRYNKSGPEAVKNSSRSGTGQQTQTA